MLSLEPIAFSVSICPTVVRRALRAVIYRRPMGDSPLLALRALGDRAPADDAARAAALRDHLAEVVWTCLEDARRHHGVGDRRVERAALSASAALGLLQRDFSVGSADLESWSYAYFRYFVKSGRSLRDIAKLLSTTNRTLERRLCAAHGLVAEALSERERRAGEHGGDARSPATGSLAADAPPGAPPAGARTPAASPPVGETPRGGGSSDARGRWAAALTDYHRQRIADGALGRHRLAERIVPIPLNVERADRMTQEGRFASLSDVLAAVDDPALLVLGPPGSGKSMLMRWLDYTLAAEALGSDNGPIPMFVDLSRFRADEPDAPPPRPLDWLAARWSAHHPDLPPLIRLMQAGRVVFILDGLDEIPHTSESTYVQRLRAWKHFLLDDLTVHPRNRAVIACRTMAYRVTMATATFPVTRVFVNHLDADGVRALLACHNPERGHAIADVVIGGPLFELARRPFMAALMAQSDIDLGSITAGHAALLTRHVREALHREIANDNPVLTGGTVLASHDVLRILNTHRGRTPWALPDRGPLFSRLSAFALRLLQGSRTSRTACVPVPYDEALDIVADPAAADILQAAHAIGVVDFDLERDEVRFTHQLWQAYFAARALVDDPTPALVPASWRAEAMAMPLEAVVAELPAGGSLPRPDETGWEDTVLFAAQMAPEPTAFIERVVQADIVLAAWAALCVAPFRPLPARLLDRLRDGLLERSRHPEADVRARLAAGRTLGLLGDPRLAATDGPHGRFIAPVLVRVAAGDVIVGHDEPIACVGPANRAGIPTHRVALGAFDIGRYPVTRAEWACFIAAGGYDDERWWDTPAGRAWRRGGGTGSGGRLTEPATWSAPLTPNCPVSGICWYEARAYARWLSARTGRRFRLPTSAEWEAAARGKDGRAFASGATLDPARANYADTRFGAASPIGLFPAGDTPEGIGDLCGNVREWTSTAWGTDPATPDFPYPYAAADGRERADASAAVRRILRGGAWSDDGEACRAALLRSALPSDRPATLGLRLAADV